MPPNAPLSRPIHSRDDDSHKKDSKFKVFQAGFGPAIGW
jgi:hypothetical protein